MRGPLRMMQRILDCRQKAAGSGMHPIFFGWVIAARRSLQSIISGLRLLSKQHLRRAGKALTSAVYQRASCLTKKHGMHPILLKFCN